MGTFTRVYRDPASFGLDPRLVARLLPDADLEALPRRAFAFPRAAGPLPAASTWARWTRPARRHGASCWPPTTTTRTGGPASEQHIGRHLVLADRLWRGDPPELWEAAQRLLDRGENRHAVQHTLMYLIRDAGGDRAKLIAELGNLP